MRIIATSDATTVTVLPRMLVKVFVSTPDTPPTSFCRRDWMTPVLVRVKKPSSIACRCSNSSHAQVAGDLLPTVEVRYVCTTPSPAESRNSAIIDRHEPPEQRDVGRPAVDGEERVVEDALHDAAAG